MSDYFDKVEVKGVVRPLQDTEGRALLEQAVLELKEYVKAQCELGSMVSFAGNPSNYTALYDGFIYLSMEGTDFYYSVVVNGQTVCNLGSSPFNRATFLYPVKKGDVITGSGNASRYYARGIFYYSERDYS